MGELLSGFIGACIVAVAGLIVAGIVAWIKRRVKLTSPHVEAVDAHDKQLAQMKPLVLMLVAVQKPQLVALLGILDALKEKMNGNFERAYAGMKEALDKFDATLMEILTGECGEKKP